MARLTKHDRLREAVFKQFDVKFPPPHGSEIYRPNAAATLADEIIRLADENAKLRELAERLGCCCGKCATRLTGEASNA